MTTQKQLANRIQEVLLSGKWVAGTNIKEQVSDLTWEQATTKVGSLNTIVDLLFHTNYYIAGLVHFFKTGNLDIKDQYSFDGPEIKSEADWQALIDRFCNDSEEFIKAVEQMTDAELDQIFFDKKYGTYHRNINVIIEHSYYHFGQMVLIKKLLETKGQ
ncbi:DinB family protein [Seonamhaeicola sp.]|uniref:DinB family protein n=1 Tax=Seonamhaeicola sp. TaxID=1912245 RepID=UPI00261A14F4|nr:DinB family protein [Seonamhaeicola sp.]